MTIYRRPNLPVYIVTATTNNLNTDSLPGNGTFTIQDAIDLANTNGGGTVVLAKASGDYFITNPAYNNIINMKSNVTLDLNGNTVRPRTSGLYNAEPEHGLITFGDLTRITAVTFPTTLTLDPAFPPGNDTEGGQEIIRLVLDAGQVSLLSVTEGGLVWYQDDIAMVQRVNGEVVWLASPIRMKDNIVASPSATYLPAASVCQNAKVCNGKIDVGANAWATTYDGPITVYGSVWCEVSDIIIEGSEYDFVTPANTNYPWAGLIYCAASAACLFNNILAEKIPYGAGYFQSTNDCEIKDLRVFAFSGPDGFSSVGPSWGMLLFGSPNLVMENCKLKFGVLESTYLGLISISGNTAKHDTMTFRNNEIIATGMLDDGTVYPVNGIWYENIGVMNITDNIIAAGDGTTTAAIDGKACGLSNIKRNGLRCQDHMHQANTPVLLSFNNSVNKSAARVLIHENYFATTAEGYTLAPGSNPTGSLNLTAGGVRVEYHHNRFLLTTIDEHAAAGAEFSMIGEQGDIGATARSMRLSATTAALASINYVSGYTVYTESTTATFAGTFEACCFKDEIAETNPVAWTFGGTYTNCQLDSPAGGGTVTLAANITNFAGGNALDVTMNAGRYIGCAVDNIVDFSPGAVTSSTHFLNCRLALKAAATVSAQGTSEIYPLVFENSQILGGATLDLDGDVHIIGSSTITTPDINVTAAADNVRIMASTLSPVGGTGTLDSIVGATRFFYRDNAVYGAVTVTNNATSSSVGDNLTA